MKNNKKSSTPEAIMRWIVAVVIVAIFFHLLLRDWGLL